ncbi:MAG: glycosyltransferase [Bacteroidales bacterium]|nr:glycosyltransferase [Bacteroidales bacterium]
MANNYPVVSVCIFAYNFERFIAKAIESVLMQRTDFNYEIIIGEDMSQDNTRGICIRYLDLFPERIKLLLRDHNLGMKKNVFDTLKEAKGTYVALLDADDYWIDSQKLQKQVDFMKSYQDFSLCCHNSIVIYEDHNIPPSYFNPRDQKDIISIEEIIMNWSMATGSMLFRNSLMTYPDWIYKSHNFDLAIQLILADKGKVKYLNEPMSVYRKSLQSNSFNPDYPFDFVYNKQIELFNYYNKFTNYKYNSTINSRIQSISINRTRYIRIKKYPFLKWINLRRILKKLIEYLEL